MRLFVSFEGPDGSGKTTVTQKVYEYFKNKDIPVILTREPGGIEISEKIRELILDPNHQEMDDRTEALLYAASRRQHLVQKILPALEKETLVVCDRFVDSSLAYQGYARGIGIEAVYQINQFAIETHLPDLTIFLDVNPEVGIQRIANNRLFIDRLEQEELAFHERVYEGYQKVLAMFPERIQRIDASLDLETVCQEAIALIEGMMTHGN